MRLNPTLSTALWKHVASLSFLFALCFSLAAQNGCEDDAGNIYGPYEELVVSDDPCENFTCIPSAFSFVWVSNSEYLDDCGGDENDEADGEDLAELIEWLEEICASNDTLEVDVDVELACEALALIEACDNGSEEACAELEALWDEFGNLWDDEEGEDDDEEDDEEEGEDDGDDNLDEEDWLELMAWLEEICASNDTLEVDIDVEMACAALELVEACADGDEAACEELEMLLEDLWNDEEGEDDDEEGEDDGEEDDGEFDEEDLEALIEWLEEVCGSNVPNDLGIDPDMACGILELIEACANGSEEACLELDGLLDEFEDLWDDEEEDDEEGENDEEDDEEGENEDEEDDDEEEADNECEVEFEFEQAMDEDGVPLPYNIVAYVDEPEADTYYFWSFGDGNESDEPNPTHIYDEVGNYEVCLTVTQVMGNLFTCTTTYCDTLMIDMDGLVRQQLTLNVLFPGQTINSVSEQTLNLNVFPNPASEVLSVRVAAGIEAVEVRTTDGRLVGQWAGQNMQAFEVPCAAWPSGAYVMQVRTSEGEVRSRVLIQH